MPRKKKETAEVIDATPAELVLPDDPNDLEPFVQAPLNDCKLLMEEAKRKIPIMPAALSEMWIDQYVMAFSRKELKKDCEMTPADLYRMPVLSKLPTTFFDIVRYAVQDGEKHAMTAPIFRLHPAFYIAIVRNVQQHRHEERERTEMDAVKVFRQAIYKARDVINDQLDNPNEERSTKDALGLSAKLLDSATKVTKSKMSARFGIAAVNAYEPDGKSMVGGRVEMTMENIGDGLSATDPFADMERRGDDYVPKGAG